MTKKRSAFVKRQGKNMLRKRKMEEKREKHLANCRERHEARLRKEAREAEAAQQ